MAGATEGRASGEVPSLTALMTTGQVTPVSLTAHMMGQESDCSKEGVGVGVGLGGKHSQACGWASV